MPWREISIVDQREEFVRLALRPGANMSELCRRFGISRSNGRKWRDRYRKEGLAGLSARSRRPHNSPMHSGAETEAEVLRIRGASNNAWGARKIAHVMEREGFADVPALSTITAILRRHGKLEERAHEHPGAFTRFEKEHPNDLWQMDFKGHFPIRQGRCHPLTVLDDHSRYALGLKACCDEQDKTVRERLIAVFRCYGLPFAMLMDNGSPWGDSGAQPHTIFTVWLMRLDIRVSHGRPYHPQTQGKDERFHRSLKAEVLKGRSFGDITECQMAFDTWRNIYNHERPHDALGLDTPSYATKSVRAPSPTHCQLSSTGPVMWCAKSMPRASSASGTSLGGWERLSADSTSLCGQPTSTASSPSSSAPKCLAQLDLRAPEGCGLVDSATALTTTPQLQHQPHFNGPLQRA